MTTTTPAEATPPVMKILARRAILAVTLIAFMLIPALALMAITQQPAASYAALGALIGIAAVMAGGRRIGVITTVAASLLAPLAIISGLSPITGAALMALMTLVIGRMTRYGLQRAVILVPVLLAWPMLSPVPWIPKAELDKINADYSKHHTSLADVLSHLHAKASTSSGGGAFAKHVEQALIEQRMHTTYLTWVAVFFFIGAIIPVLALPLLTKKRPSPELVPHSRSEAMPYTISVTILAAGGVYYFLNHPKQAAGAFFIAAVLLLSQIGGDIKWGITIQRVLGTIAGVLLTFAIMPLVGGNSFVEYFGMPFPLTLYLIGIVFSVGAIMVKFGKQQWLYFLLIAPTTAMLNAYTTNQVISLGKQRLADNVAGALLVVVAALITLGASRILGRGETSEEPAVAPPASPA